MNKQQVRVDRACGRVERAAAFVRREAKAYAAADTAEGIRFRDVELMAAAREYAAAVRALMRLR